MKSHDPLLLSITNSLTPAAPKRSYLNHLEHFPNTSYPTSPSEKMIKNQITWKSLAMICKIMWLQLFSALCHIKSNNNFAIAHIRENIVIDVHREQHNEFMITMERNLNVFLWWRRLLRYATWKIAFFA